MRVWCHRIPHRAPEGPNPDIAEAFTHEKSLSRTLCWIYHASHIIFTRRETIINGVHIFLYEENKTPAATLIEAKKDKSRGFGKSIHVTWQQSAKVLATIRAQNIASRTPVFLIN